MKRKLDINDAPVVEVTGNTTEPQPAAIATSTFESFNLDPRLLQAIAKSRYSTPTPVQAKVVPLALEGKDILATAKTGTGKTVAYVLPTLQSILLRNARQSLKKEKATTVLVLVPTRDLADQINKVFISFTEFCSREIRSLNLTQQVSDAVLVAKLHELPDIVVSTPGRASQLVQNGSLSLEKVEKLVIDEADRLLGLEYEDDISYISKMLPRGGVQTFLVSATLTTEVDQLKGVFCRDPVLIKLSEDGSKDGDADSGGEITQYVVKCAEDEKFLLVYIIFKLKLVKGKCIIFVADVDRSYRVKLYLEQFGIRSCVLNAELPINSRIHAIEEFNKDLYDILIAADEHEVVSGVRRTKGGSDHEENLENEVENGDFQGLSDAESDEQPSKKQKTSSKKSGSSKEFSLSRGIDFHNVSLVLNFDLPRSSKSYTHRIGRTARGHHSNSSSPTGTAISFVVPSHLYGKHPPTSHISTRHDEKVFAKITAREEKKGHEIKPYQFDEKQIEAFRYRMNDALRAVTRVAIREARAREIKNELLRSQKLRKHFDENPEELKFLSRKGDGGTSGGAGMARVQGHLKHVPDYLLPGGGAKKSEDVGFIGINGDDKNRKDRKGRGKKKVFRKGKGGPGMGRSGKRNDPLKSFKTGGRKK